MLMRYDVGKDELVELTQEYFDSIQRQFGKLLLLAGQNNPDLIKQLRDQMDQESSAENQKSGI